MAGEAPRNSSRTSAKKELRLGTPEVTRAAIGLWYARTAILLAFAGILLVIVFYGASRALEELTTLPRLLMLAAVVIVVAVFFGLVLAAASPTLTQQIPELARGLAAGATTLTKQVASFADQANLLQNIDLVQLLSGFLSPWGIATLPYLGPIIGAVPMVLVAGGESLNIALWVVGLYAIIQFLESYLLTPLIQARAMSMPPTLVILSQLVLGAVFGLLGLALATPLAAAATVPLRYFCGIGDDGAKARAARSMP